MPLKQLSVLAIAFTLLCLPIAGLGTDLAHHMQKEPGASLAISVELRDLLNQEMAAIQQGMMDLVPAIAAGEWQQVSAIGSKIKASFIMKQKLTSTQKEELHRVLPPAFIDLDQNFHKSAGMLAHAAKMKNADVMNFYYYKLHDACVSCHAKYATERFPGLANLSGENEHHH